MNFETVVQSVTHIPEKSFLKLKSVTTEMSLPKGHLVFKADRINNNIYFIGEGLARGYVQQDPNEVTFAFFREGEILLSIQSYVENIPGYENIDLLEDCTLYQLRKEELELLYATDIHLANWGRKLADKSFVETEKQLISRQFKNTAERYEDFITKSPDLLQRVKLKHVASYLGMTQVTLSRIRAKG